MNSTVPPSNRRRTLAQGCHRLPSTGFTLIELLLAMVLVALVMSAISGVFYGAVRLRNRTTQLTTDALPLLQALARLRQDLAGIVLPGGVLSSNLVTDATPLTLARGQPVSPAFFVNTGEINDLEPWGEVQSVTYYLRAPTNRFVNSGQDLFRMVTRNLLAPNPELPEEQWLMTGVERMTFSYYDGTQWKTSWNSTNDVTVLPTAIKVEIQLAPQAPTTPTGRQVATARQSHPVVQLVSPILLTAVTNQSSSAGGGQP